MKSFDDLPPFLREILAALRTVGTPLLVGGCVRDKLMGRTAKDFDIEVYGASAASVTSTLESFGNVDPVGKSFGVIKLRRDGIEYDISLPRTEKKTGAGHRGFEIGTDPNLKPSEALARRDFTINSMAFDPFSGELIDPHEGREDLKRNLLRHTSDAFIEDPLRVMRAFQFAARFGLTLDAGTAALSKSIAHTYSELPVERIWGEWAKWAGNAIRPSAGLRVLEQTGWLIHFPEIAALRGLQQEPEWHPEGDVFEHTCHCLDALATLADWQQLGQTERQIVMFAVLTHDFGKATTTVRAEKRGVERWTSPGHENASGPLAESFLQRVGAQNEMIARVRPLVENHHSHFHGATPPSAASVRRLARRLAPSTLIEWLLVLRADHLGRPPLVSQETEERIAGWSDAARELDLERSAPKPILQGRHLIAAGMKPGPGFKPILDEALEAQLDGAFADEAGACVWLKGKLARHQQS